MRSKTVTIIIILVGLVFGSFLGEITAKVPYMGWLNYGQNIGIPNFAVDLYSVQFNMGLTFNCTIASIIGLILALIIYYKIIK